MVGVYTSYKVFFKKRQKMNTREESRSPLTQTHSLSSGASPTVPAIRGSSTFCLADIFRSHSTPSHFHSITQGKKCNVHMYLFPGAAVEPCLVDWACVYRVAPPVAENKCGNGAECQSARLCAACSLSLLASRPRRGREKADMSVRAWPERSSK